MKIVQEAKKNIAIIWRPPKPVQGIYRPMKYLIKTQVDDGTILYNVVTSEMVLLNEDEVKLFGSSSREYCSEMNELITHHYLVKEDYDEEKSVAELRAIVRKLKPFQRVSGFTILPTTECNARCFYCFESDHKRCTMTEETVADVIKYIAEKCDSKPVKIEWFGGEPLVAQRQITQICEGLKQKEIKYKSSMVSNAYLFDDNLIRIAKDEWHLNFIQITLDGTEEIYNTTKAYVNPKDNPYDRVMKNIKMLLDNKITVVIRLNVTDRNADDLSDLVDELSERFGGEEALSCYAHAVYDGVGFDPLNYDQEMLEFIDKKTIALDDKLRSKKLNGSLTRLPVLEVTHCMADNDSARLIYPDGTIGKCENKSSLENIGNIYDDITNEEKHTQYRTYDRFPECDDCCLFPNCLNLKICPETGKCSKVKKEWKIRRYTDLVKEKYLVSGQKKTNEKEADSTHPECES